MLRRECQGRATKRRLCGTRRFAAFTGLSWPPTAPGREVL